MPSAKKNKKKKTLLHYLPDGLLQTLQNCVDYLHSSIIIIII